MIDPEEVRERKFSSHRAAEALLTLLCSVYALNLSQFTSATTLQQYRGKLHSVLALGDRYKKFYQTLNNA